MKRLQEEIHPLQLDSGDDDDAADEDDSRELEKVNILLKNN